MSAIQSEGEWLVSLDEKRKLVFLATLGHELTIAGRNSYTVQEEGLDNPTQLRTINEIQHRVLACLREILTGQPNVEFQGAIAGWVLGQSDTELQGIMLWAWRTAKERIL